MRPAFLLVSLLLVACSASPPSSSTSWTEVSSPVSGYQCFEYSTGFSNTKTRTAECFPGSSSGSVVSRGWEKGSSPVSGFTCWFYSTGISETKTHASACFPQ